MAQIAEAPTTRRAVPWIRLAAATLLAAGPIALIWLVAVPMGPLVCPAV